MKYFLWIMAILASYVLFVYLACKYGSEPNDKVASAPTSQFDSLTLDCDSFAVEETGLMIYVPKNNGGLAK